MKKKGCYKNHLWLATATILVLISSIISKSTAINTCMAVAGVIYVILIAKESKAGYIFGIINVILYIVVSWKEYLYGTAILNTVYSLPMLVYGLVYWGNKKKKAVIIKLKNSQRLFICLFTIIAIIIYYLFATRIASNALVDSINVCVNIVATYLMAKKYLEQWIGWLVINTTNLLFWVHLSTENIQNLPMVLMNLIYVINTIYGLVSWNKKLKLRIGENEGCQKEV